MSMLDLLSRRDVWERFYEYKASLACPGAFLRELRAFIDRGAYLPVCGAIEKGLAFPLPKKAVICKMSTQKKRTVYTYPAAENTVLKLLTWLLLREYDGVFSDGLWSFRPGRTAKQAVQRLLRTPGIGGMYAYKTDISNYFNSIPVEALLPLLRETTGEDPRLFAFLRRLLEEPGALDGGRILYEQKGIMAGTPLSAFYANLFLKDADRQFAERGVPYARYSDDIILFSDTKEGAEAAAEALRRMLAERGLEINPDKEAFFTPEEGWVFLGFSCRNGTVDIAPASVKKLKGKMRRKMRALQRWQRRNGLEAEKAARAFIRIFNRKLFENAAGSELTWAYWFFPVITTDESLRALDAYAEDCLRRLLSGKNTKARYNVRYETLRQLGFRSIVHEYYSFRKKAREKT